MLQVLAGWRCEPICAGGRLRLDDERALPLGLQLAPGLCPSCPDEYKVSFTEFSWDDCVVAPGLRLSLVFVEGLQGEDTVSVDEILGSWFVYVGDG